MIEPQIDAPDESAFLHHVREPLSSHLPLEGRRRIREESTAVTDEPVLTGPPTGVKPTNETPMPTIQQDLLSIIRGFRNGLMYGIKIRLPHVVVMTFLFVDGSLKKKWDIIYSKTKEHSWHLGQYVALYKLMCAIIRRVLGRPNNWLVHFLGGAIAGGIIWGEKTAVNHQINLYVFSRICFSMALSGIERGYWKNYSSYGYKIFAVLVWAIIMYLFEYEEYNVNPSLKESMDYLYHNDKEVTDWTIHSLIQFFKA